MIEAIQQAVRPHDQYQIETKLDYELLAEQDTRYRVATYIFIPQSLGVNATTYPKHYFYRDIQNYIRLKTPAVNLVELSENATTPLGNIRRIMQTENWSHDPDLKRELINSCKLLGAMLKSALRDHFDLIERRIGEATTPAQAQLLIDNLIEEFLVRTEQITRQYRAFFAAFNLPHMAEDLLTAYKLTDEYISLLIEESGVELFQIVSDQMTEAQQTELLQRLGKQIKAETAYRRLHGYPSLLQGGRDNEVYAFRVAVLKKYAASVLHLSTSMSREGRTQEQLLFALAAGISMIFATIVAFYFQLRYGTFTFPVFVALVIGYMFKDRIKEFTRDSFNSRLRRNLYDSRIDIRTSDGRYKLGVLRQKMSFVTEQDIPKPVLRARNKDLFIDLDNDGQSEVIICYTKEITLYAGAFERALVGYPNVTGLNDIMRYDIRAYLNKMAEPVQERLYVKNGRLQTMATSRVYHLNFIARYRSLQPQKEKLHTRTRVVLTRYGIKRVEGVPLKF
jgi:hypothetical protein